MTGGPRLVKVVDLIEAGLLPRPAKLHGQYREHRIEATLESDGTFVCGSITSSSPSVAAGHGITSKNGQKSLGRNYWSINGWLFWRVSGLNGESKTLDDLRREFLGD
jgi:hypothetical protein